MHYGSKSFIRCPTSRLNCVEGSRRKETARKKKNSGDKGNDVKGEGEKTQKNREEVQHLEARYIEAGENGKIEKP